MSAAHLSATFSKELERAVYGQLPVTRERLRHEVGVCGAGGAVRNLIFVSRLVLYAATKHKGSDRAQYPAPPTLPEFELRHLERCAERVASSLGVSDVAA